MIEEFKATLDKIEWGDKLKEETRKKREHQHIEFVEKLKQEKVFRQEIYAVERIVEAEERKAKRKQDLDYESKKLKEEQDKLLENIALLNKFY